MTIRFSGVLTAAQQKLLMASLEQKLTDWAKGWFTSGSNGLSIAPGAFESTLFAGQSWQGDKADVLFYQPDVLCCAESKKDSVLAQLAMAVSPESDGDKKLMDHLQRLMLQQLSDLLLIDEDNSKTGLNSTAPNSFDFALKVVFTIAGLKLNLWFSARYLHLFAKKTLKTVETLPAFVLKQMSAEQQISMRLTMESQQLSVGQLMSLQVGHVIPLNQAIKNPLTLKASEGQTQLKGFLVKKEQNKAVYITGIAK